MNNKNDGLQTPSSSSMTTTSITPPLGVVMDQEMREEETISTNGDKSITMKLDRYVCGIVSTVSPDALTLHLYDINTVVESVTERKYQLWLFSNVNVFCFSPHCLFSFL